LNLESLKEQWEGLPEWQRILFVVFITALIMYAIYTFAIEPKQIEREKLLSEVKILETQVERLKKFARPEIQKKLEEKLAYIKAEIDDLNRQLEEIKTVIPTEEKTQEILRFIADSAIKSNVVLNNFRVSSPEKILMRYNKSKDMLEVVTDKKKTKDKSFVKLNRVKIDLDMNSRNMGGIISLLNRIGKSERFFRIDKLTIQKKKGKNTSIFNMKITISTYYM